jgi:hypothetical protein
MNCPGQEVTHGAIQKQLNVGLSSNLAVDNVTQRERFAARTEIMSLGLALQCCYIVSYLLKSKSTSIRISCARSGFPTSCGDKVTRDK